MYKKISMLLCGLILALNAHAIVQSDIFTDGISYRIIDKSNAYVEAIGCYGDKIVVPASFTMDGITYSVKSIATEAFRFSNMRSVSIEDGIAVIPDFTFYKCDKLEEVRLPSTLKSIGDFAFSNCKNLCHITIPQSVTTIGECAFFECRNLENVKLETPNATIGDKAFANCPKLKSFEGKLASSDQKCLVVNGVLKAYKRSPSQNQSRKSKTIVSFNATT